MRPATERLSSRVRCALFMLAQLKEHFPQACKAVIKKRSLADPDEAEEDIMVAT